MVRPLSSRPDPRQNVMLAPEGELSQPPTICVRDSALAKA
jgi:hypothetical protein